MNIFISPNSFKGTFSSVEATNIIAEGLILANPDFNITKLPIADGGDGTLDVFKFYNKYQVISEKVKNPLGNVINSEYLLIDNGNTAVIEFASSSGLKLIHKNEKNVEVLNSFGTGELILSAINKGVKKIILTLGGSATIDGGSGILKALGVNFIDDDNNQILDGNYIINLKKIDLKNFILNKSDVDFVLLSDVNIPLLGKNGCVEIFGKQKGLKKEKNKIFENYLYNFSQLTNIIFKLDAKRIVGGGAAGGAAAFLKIFFKAEIYSGTNFILNHIKYFNFLKKESVVITGEGFLDEQSIYGKAPVSLSNYLKDKNIFLIAACGKVDFDVIDKLSKYFDLILPACESTDISFCTKNSRKLLKELGTEIGKILILRSSILNS